MKARVFFWYQGSFPHQKSKGCSVDLEIDIEDSEIGDDSLANNKADEVLSDAITNGLIDHLCDAGVSNFGVEKISFKKHRKRADFKY